MCLFSPANYEIIHQLFISGPEKNEPVAKKPQSKSHVEL